MCRARPGVWLGSRSCCTGAHLTPRLTPSVDRRTRLAAPRRLLYTYSDTCSGMLGRHATIPAFSEAFRGSYRAPPEVFCMPGAVSICFMRSNDPSSERYLNAFVSCHLPHVVGSPVLNHPISTERHSQSGAAAAQTPATYTARDVDYPSVQLLVRPESHRAESCSSPGSPDLKRYSPEHSR